MSSECAPSPGKQGRCRLCWGSDLTPLEEFSRLRLVTSDSKPSKAHAELDVCAACGFVQKVPTEAWMNDVAQLYRDYTIYHQAGGSEQLVFTPGAPAGQSRSRLLLENLTRALSLPATGRLLDIGCGNGAFLKCFGAELGGWELFGSELNTKYEAEVRALAGVKAFFSCTLDQIPGEYDLVLLSHVLEHITELAEFVDDLRRRMARNATVLIEVPYHRDNPFELLIVDHCNHFTPSTLQNLLRRRQLDVTACHTDWVPKEISAVARSGVSSSAQRAVEDQGGAPAGDPAEDPALAVDQARKAVAWLSAVADQARELARRGRFGLFGTSIAATWLYSEVDHNVEFFVDEDPRIAGRTYLGRPVYAPQSVPEGSHVYLGLAPKISANIFARLQASSPSYSPYCVPPFH